MRNVFGLIAIVACFGLAFGGIETSIDGETRGDGSYQLDLSPSEHLTNAVLVYTEPSGTLMLAVYDTAFLQTSEGRALEASLSPLAQVEGDLPNFSPTVLLPSPPPASDNAVRIVGYGEYNGTTFTNEQLANTSTNLASYGLRLSIVGWPAGGGLSIETCSKCGANEKNCGRVTDCTSPSASSRNSMSAVVARKLERKEELMEITDERSRQGPSRSR